MNYEAALKYGERQCHGTEKERNGINSSSIKEDILRLMILEKYYRILNETEGALTMEQGDQGEPEEISMEPEGLTPVDGVGSSEDGKEETLDVITQSMFDDSWNYAKREILSNAYKESIRVHELVGKNSAMFKVSEGIEPSMYCRGMYLYREYVEKQDIDIGVAAGFAAIVVVVIIAVTCLLRRRRGNGAVMRKQYDPDALNAANFVLAKLAQQRHSHFSVDQFRRYTMSRLNVTPRIWDQTVQYLNESDSVSVIHEEFNGALRPCWKFKESLAALHQNECETQ